MSVNRADDNPLVLNPDDNISKSNDDSYLLKLHGEWSRLPYLPLRCILKYLSVRDALAAMSACRHWRTAVWMYEGRKDTLNLHVSEREKNAFITRLFKKHVKKLHIYIDVRGEEWDIFASYILPQYFDTLKLTELSFIGSKFAEPNSNNNISLPLINRIFIETVMFRHMRTLRKFTMMGCEMDVLRKCATLQVNEKLVERCAREMDFDELPLNAENILSHTNIQIMMFSKIQHIITDYDLVSTTALETLSRLSRLSLVTLNVTRYTRRRLDWRRLNSASPNRLAVAINVIGVPARRLPELMEDIFVEDINLVSFKVMFCKTLYSPLILHVAELYKESLREFVWVDSPAPTESPRSRSGISVRTLDLDNCDVNPLILLCWQCSQLRRLVIHGYWVWQYDMVGFVRLRKTLAELEVSALYEGQAAFTSAQHLVTDNSVTRVLASDAPRAVDADYVEKMNEYTDFKWMPVKWKDLHPALRARSTPENRHQYVCAEAMRPLSHWAVD